MNTLNKFALSLLPLLIAACGGGSSDENVSGSAVKTIVSPRCKMNEGGQGFAQNDIDCARGVYYGTMLREARKCKIDFTGLSSGFTATIGDKTATFTPAKSELKRFKNHLAERGEKKYFKSLNAYIYYENDKGKRLTLTFDVSDFYSKYKTAPYGIVWIDPYYEHPLKNELNISGDASGCAIENVIFH